MMTSINIDVKLYKHKFGEGSEKNLEGVHPSLVEVARTAITLCKYDGTVIPGGGLRTLEQAKDNVRRGTGILNSLHRKQADGWGHAIDLIPYPIDWNNLERFKHMAWAVAVASAMHNVPIRQGCNWDSDWNMGEPKEYDYPHFELTLNPYKLSQAQELLEERRERLQQGILKMFNNYHPKEL